MKICITRTSDYGYKEIKEYKSLDECVKELLNPDLYPKFAAEVVVSKPNDWDPPKSKECEYVVEIYDTWRE